MQQISKSRSFETAEITETKGTIREDELSDGRKSTLSIHHPFIFASRRKNEQGGGRELGPRGNRLGKGDGSDEERSSEIPGVIWYKGEFRMRPAARKQEMSWQGQGGFRCF